LDLLVTHNVSLDFIRQPSTGERTSKPSGQEKCFSCNEKSQKCKCEHGKNLRKLSDRVEDLVGHLKFRKLDYNPYGPKLEDILFGVFSIIVELLYCFENVGHHVFCCGIDIFFKIRIASL